jgi:DNA-binding transcriptional ArsR family regulator
LTVATSNAIDLGLRRRFVATLADPSRVSILEALRGGELRVSDVAAQTGLSQPNVSKHLACLRGCGLVDREQRGREVFYRSVEGIETVFDAIDVLLDRVAGQIDACALTAVTVEGAA